MRNRLLAGAMGVLAIVALLAGRADVRAATPTPSPTMTRTVTGAPPVATPTPLPPNTLKLRVVNDLNGDGVAQADEPGLPNWRITAGCSDAILPLTTDSDGYAYVLQPSFDNQSGTLGCFRIDRPFGWLPPRALSVRLPATLDLSKPYVFLMHDLGRTVTELRGEAIGGGLPLVQGVPGVAEPFAHCGHFFFEGVGDIATHVGVIVTGGDTAAGCPSAGAAITPSISGRAAGAPIAFVPGTSVSTSFVSQGDSMRFYNYRYPLTAAWVFDVASGTIARDCMVARDLQGFVPQGSQRIFVISDETLPGCGAPGRSVLFFSGDQRLAPRLDWRAGDIDSVALSPETGMDIVISPPETGSAGLLPPSHATGGQPSPTP
jgi:hypothetical protein